MPGWIRWLAMALVLFLQGCLLDIAPAREPIADVWKAHMLAGEYGEWAYGKKASFVGKDEVNSFPLSASGTRYGITVSEEHSLWGGAWSMAGGMVGRIVLTKTNIELFGKQVARVHGPWHTSSDQDYSYEFFLVVRPIATGRGRVIRQWTFPREEVARTVPSGLAEKLHAEYSGAELQKELEQQKGLFVEGFLRFDERSRTATVTITGLVQPFGERVDLSRELPAPN